MIDELKKRNILKDMHEVFNTVNLELAQKNGFSLEEATVYVDNSKDSTFWILSKVLESMVKKDYIKFD
jgi:hypothetical protein